MIGIITKSGRIKALPESLDQSRVAGLDDEWRIVVDDFDARNAEPIPIGNGILMQPHMFGLTLCCNASDKGVEDGVVCRGCYSEADVGNYIFREPDGEFRGLDPVERFAEVSDRTVTLAELAEGDTFSNDGGETWMVTAVPMVALSTVAVYEDPAAPRSEESMTYRVWVRGGVIVRKEVTP